MNSDEDFLNILLQKHCITERHKDRIMELRTKSARSKQLLSIIRRRSFAHFQWFKIALGAAGQHGVMELLNIETGNNNNQYGHWSGNQQIFQPI